MKALTPSQTMMFVENCLKVREIPYISGPPGIGKSDLVYQIGHYFDLKVLDIRLSQMLPEDLTGLPSLNNDTGKASYNPFDTFPMAGDAIPKGYNGWLIFLDELSSASEEVFAAIYSLLLGHRVGGKQVHEKALIIAAGNRSTDSAIARPLPDTLITRMMPVEMKVSSKDWLKWCKTPESKSNDSVVSFIAKYPDMLIGTIDPNKRDELEPYHTPRGWGKVFKIMDFHEREAKKNQITKKDSSGIPFPAKSQGEAISPPIQAMLFSAVGVIAGQAFKEHYDESMQLPFPWDVAQSPSSVPIPSTNAAKAELTASLAEFFIETSEQSRDNLLQFMNRMGGEHSALFAQILVERLGNTVSDQKLIGDVKQRLDVKAIDIPEPLGADPDSSAFLQGNRQRP
jgi:hypothetical protein